MSSVDSSCLDTLSGKFCWQNLEIYFEYIECILSVEGIIFSKMLRSQLVVYLDDLSILMLQIRGV